MGLKYIVLHKDVLYYRRRYPKNLKPAFSGKEFYRHSLKLPKNAPDSKITAAWQKANEQFELLVEMATNSNLEAINQAEITRKAKVLLRARGLTEGSLAEYPEELWQILPEAEVINQQQKDGEATTKEKIFLEAGWLLISKDKIKKPLLLSECWDIYVKAKGIDVTSRNGKRTYNRWMNWLKVCGDSVINTQHIEEGLDRHKDQRLKEIKPSSIKRELNLVMAVIRFAAQSRRIPLNITPPTLPKYKNTIRKALSQDQQKELVQKILANEFKAAESVALLLYLQGGVITSESQRLKSSSVFLSAKVPHIIIESDTKTEARKRIVPITVGTSWIRKALATLKDSSEMALGRRWAEITESGASASLKTTLPEGVTAHGLRHSFRANAIASSAGDNAAIIGGWKTTNGLSPIMFNYGEDALSQTEVLKGLQKTSQTINKHLIAVDNHLKLVKEE